MKRPWFALSFAVALACYDNSSSPSPFLVVNPILDSLFVGDSKPPRSVTLYDAKGQPQNPGPVTWTVDADTAATIEADGTIKGVGKGEAVIRAHAAGADPGSALVIVSRPLDLTLLMDTVVLMAGMPGDTFTIPLAIQQKTPGAYTVSFDPSPTPSVYTINTTTGLVTAVDGGGPIQYVAHVTDGTNTVSDAGAVVVMAPPGTTGGRFYMTVLGTQIRHQGGDARAMNYTKLDGALAFRLTDSLFSSTFYEKVFITLLDPVTGTGTFDIDSLNPDEAVVSNGPLNPFCNPKRPWAVWLNIRPLGISAYSNTADKQPVAGELSITRYEPLLAGDGHTISGRFRFTAQRADLYSDPLGVLTIRGTFVAPLVENTTACLQ